MDAPPRRSIHDANGLNALFGSPNLGHARRTRISHDGDCQFHLLSDMAVDIRSRRRLRHGQCADLEGRAKGGLDGNVIDNIFLCLCESVADGVLLLGHLFGRDRHGGGHDGSHHFAHETDGQGGVFEDFR